MVKDKVKNILIIHVSGRVGDTLFITPLLETISKHYSNSFVTVLTHRNTVSLLENCKYIDLLNTISKKRARYRGWTFIKKYDLAFISSSPDEDADSLVSYACRVSKKIVAFKPTSSRLRKCVDKLVDKDFNGKRHIIDYYHDLTNALNIVPSSKRVNFYATSKELARAQKILQESALKTCKLIIAIKITSLSSRSYRDWPEEHLVKLMNMLIDKYKDVGFIAFGGLSEYGKYENIAQKIHAPFLNLSEKELREFGSIMNYVNLYIGVDTGVTHLMSSYDVPMVVLYHPLAPKSQYSPINHPNFYSLECPKNLILNMNKEDMMATIDPDQVFEKINFALTGDIK